MDDDDQAVRIAALVCLTVIVVTSIIGITLTALLTDRDLRNAERLTALIALCVALLGGLTLAGLRRRRHRWRIEREDVNGGPER